MKKRIFVLLIMMAVLMTSCVWDPEGYIFNYEELKEEVIGVELIEYENSDPKIVKKSSEVLPFDFNKMKSIKTLASEQTEEFIKSFTDIRFMKSYNYSNAAVGISIKINYKNGEFLIVSSNIIDDRAYRFVVKFDSNGDVIEVIGGFESGKDFVKLVKDFFEIEIS